MREVPLSQGKTALVSDEDFERISQFKWSASLSKQTGKWYAVRCDKGKMLKMHRVVMGVTNPTTKVDHRDGNGLNNCRTNLRPCTNAENGMNTAGHSDRKYSSYKGVTWNKRKRKFMAQIYVKGHNVGLGYFTDEIEAALAYDAAAATYHGAFAYQNIEGTINA